MNTAVYAVFILTYLLIASRRLSLLPIGRPAGALFGATLMVAVGGLTPTDSYRAIDHDTILLLFSMMVLSIYLERAGFFTLASDKIVKICGTPWKLLAMLAWISGCLSAFLMNDTICIFLTPVVVGFCSRYRLPFAPYLIALATSANIGSAASLVGNPQNMIIGNMSGFHFARFLVYAAPPAIAGLCINTALLHLFYRKILPAGLFSISENLVGIPVNIPRIRTALGIMLGVISGFFAGFHLGYTALAGVMILILQERRDPQEVFARIDWSILVFFCCLFIVVQGLNQTGVIERMWAVWEPFLRLTDIPGIALFTTIMTAGSNLVSNVPMVMLTGPMMNSLGSAELGWVLLAFTTTVAGNLTLIGSVANIIVAEGAKNYYTLGFFEYLRFGLVSTLCVLAAGVTVIYWIMG